MAGENRCPEPDSWLLCLLVACYHPGGDLRKHIIQQLKSERERVQKQLQRIDQALAALGSTSNGASHTMSAAGRARISLAQKARWAKQKAQGHAAKPKRTMSAAARKKIAAAQRLRWAKVKRAA
jgi:hypothetical protein